VIFDMLEYIFEFTILDFSVTGVYGVFEKTKIRTPIQKERL